MHRGAWRSGRAGGRRSPIWRCATPDAAPSSSSPARPSRAENRTGSSGTTRSYRPRSGTISIAVYCIERERWSLAPGNFSLGGHLAHPGLRLRTARGASQEGVWDEVKRRSTNAGVDSPTDNYNALFKDSALRRKIAACRRHFDGVPRAHTVGAVAVVTGRIVGADLFADPTLFNREWPRLFNSYAMDYFSGGILGHRELSPRRRIVPGHLPGPGVTAFIRAALAARYTPISTPGEGRLFQISGGSTGEALLWRGQALHVGLFGAPHAVAPRPTPALGSTPPCAPSAPSLRRGRQTPRNRPPQRRRAIPSTDIFHQHPHPRHAMKLDAPTHTHSTGRRAATIATAIALALSLALPASVAASGLLLPKEPALPPLAIKHQRVDIRVDNGVATASVEQVFLNTTKRNLEAGLRLPTAGRRGGVPTSP